jgi:GGDEF domain-containing protein
VLLPGLRRAADAAPVAQRLVDAMAAPFSIEQHRLMVRAHGGLVLARGGEAAFEVLMAGAQARLHDAEAAGRGQVHSSTLPG